MSHQARWKKAGLKLDPGLSQTRQDETSWAVSERNCSAWKGRGRTAEGGSHLGRENPAYKEDRARWESLG